MSYTPTLSNPYVYEDTGEGHLTVGALPPLTWRSHDRWLSNASFALTHRISDTATADHAVNVAVHLVNTALVAALVWPVSTLWGLWALIVFGLYPGQVEAVASVSSRADLLMATGVLLACWGVVRRQGWAVMVGVVGAALSKEAGVMALPLAALLAWQLGVRVYSGWVIAAGLAGLALGAGLVTQFGWPLAHPVDIGRAIVQACTLLLWPWPLRIDYAWGWITAVSAMATMVSAMAVSSVYLFGERLFYIDTGWIAWIGFAVVWTLTAVLPLLLVRRFEPLHLHHLYVPWVGVSLALASLFTPKESLYASVA